MTHLSEVYATSFLLQWNARHLMPKRSDFKDFVSRYKFPVLAICEGHVSKQFRLPNYVLYPSNAQLRSSRVMLGIRSNLSSIEVVSDIDSSGEFVA